MYIPRIIETTIKSRLFQGKVTVLYGPRQSGKTTLVKNLIASYPQAKYVLCEVPEVREVLETQSPERIIAVFGSSRLVVLDEAQTIRNIGRILKILVDTHPEIQIIATGSSSFELASEIVEPLTGRKYEYKLLPLSLEEILQVKDRLQVTAEIERYLRYGQYPGIYTATQDQGELLIQEIASSYLFKDIIAYQDVRNSEVLMKLLQLLALQIGQEVSFTELSRTLGIDQLTVQRYIDLLEKIFVLYRLTPFSRNLRNELNKKRKIYFYDLGIRNALIRNFNPLTIRDDVGALWENFCINERIKYTGNHEIFVNRYFWRTWEKQEIDYVEEHAGQLHGYECKWTTPLKHLRAPSAWREAYPEAHFSVVSRENIEEFTRGNIQ